MYSTGPVVQNCYDIKQGCRSLPEPGFLSGSGSYSYSYSTVKYVIFTGPLGYLNFDYIFFLN